MATNKPTQTLVTDTFNQMVTDVNTISLDLGATGRLNTNEDSDAIAAINELEVAIRGTSNNLVESDLTTAGLTATDLTAAVVELDSDIGARPHTTLTTTAKTLTGAINELDSDIGARPHTTLNTTAKTLTGAINELFADIAIDSDGNNNHLVADNIFGSFEKLDSALGSLVFDADIDDKTDITTAINSLSVDLASLDSSSSLNTNTIGSLRLLDSDGFTGDERLKVVNALNALRADIPKIFDETGTQLN